MRKVSAGLVVIVLAFSVLLTVGVQPAESESSARTVVVPDDYQTIQEAIDYANAGDTV